jgi:hypothetical protein
MMFTLTTTNTTSRFSSNTESIGIIAIFISTFFYMLLGSGILPGVINGIIFYSIGMILVSTLIALPLMALKARFSTHPAIIPLMGYLITFFLTRTAYIAFFSI